MEMLHLFARALGYGNTELARRANIAHANVGRYFRGEARVPLEFMIAVVRALGLEFWEFFELAYATKPAEPSEARRKIERLLEILPVRRVVPPKAPEPSPPAQVPAMQRPEIEKLFDQLRQELQARLDAQQATPPDEGETESGGS